jgi:hypothetical protein
MIPSAFIQQEVAFFHMTVKETFGFCPIETRIAIVQTPGYHGTGFDSTIGLSRVQADTIVEQSKVRGISGGTNDCRYHVEMISAPSVISRRTDGGLDSTAFR